MKLGKILTYSLIGLASIGVVGGAGYVIGTKLDNGNEKQSIYFSINNLSKIGKNDEFIFERNKKKELELTYNKASYKYLGENVTSFKYGNGKTAVLCSVFGNDENLVTLYYDTEELLYIQAKTTITLDDGNNFEKKILYNANGEILFENQPFQLSTLLNTTYTYGNEKITTHLSDDNRSMIINFNGKSYTKELNELNAEQEDFNGGEVETDYSFLIENGETGPYKMYYFNNFPDNGLFSSSIHLIVKSGKLIGINYNEDKGNGFIESCLKVTDTVITNTEHAFASMFDWTFYAVMFDLTKTENLTFELYESSVNGLIPVNITHNGVTYTYDCGINYSSIDEGKYEFINSDTNDSIIIYVNRYSGNQLRYQTKINNVLSEIITEELVLKYDAKSLIANKTFQYTENETTHQFAFNEAGDQLTINGNIYPESYFGKEIIMLDNQSVKLICIQFVDNSTGLYKIFYIKENGDVYFKTLEQYVKLQVVES